jgi:hypothetical protein
LTAFDSLIGCKLGEWLVVFSSFPFTSFSDLPADQKIAKARSKKYHSPHRCNAIVHYYLPHIQRAAD